MTLKIINPAEQGVELKLPEGCKALGLDIDDTITAWPAQFSAMSNEARQLGIRVVIITSRSEQGRRETVGELNELGIHFDALRFLPAMSWANEHCPHRHLNWYQRWLWYKIRIAEEEGVTHLFDDDAVFKTNIFN